MRIELLTSYTNAHGKSIQSNTSCLSVRQQFVQQSKVRFASNDDSSKSDLAGGILGLMSNLIGVGDFGVKVAKKIGIIDDKDKIFREEANAKLSTLNQKQTNVLLKLDPIQKSLEQVNLYIRNTLSKNISMLGNAHFNVAYEQLVLANKALNRVHKNIDKLPSTTKQELDHFHTFIHNAQLEFTHAKHKGSNNQVKGESALFNAYCLLLLGYNAEAYTNIVDAFQLLHGTTNLHSIKDSFIADNQYSKAALVQKMIVYSDRKNHGDESQTVERSLLQLAELQVPAGSLEEAEQTLEESYAIARKHMREKSTFIYACFDERRPWYLGYANVYESLGEEYQKQNQPQDTLRCYNKAMEFTENVLEPENLIRKLQGKIDNLKKY